MQRGAFISDDVNLIANNNLVLYDNASVGDDSLLYAGQRVSILTGANNQHIISILSPKEIYIYNNVYLSGIICGGSVSFGTNSFLAGSIMAGNYGVQNVLQNGARVYYYSSQFPVVPPPGISFAYSQVPGSWKELQ